MVDSERLIMVIESFECLWNTSLQEYHNKNLKNLSWTIVCQELVEDWAILSQNKKKSKLNDIKKRWHNIRDYYKKEIDQQKNVEYGQTPKKRKKYVFADILEFLRPVYEHRNTSGIYENTKAKPASDETLVTSVTPTTSTSSTNKTKKTYIKQNAIESSINNKAQENEANDSGSNLRPIDDPDLMFLKSLLPDLKGLTSSEKFDFKIGIMQLLKSIKQSVPQTQSSLSTQDHNKYCIPSNRNIKIVASRTPIPGGKVSGDVAVQYILPDDVSNNIEIDTNTYFDHTMSDD